MKKFAWILFVMITALGCAHHAVEPENRPGNNPASPSGGSSGTSHPDYTYIMENGSPRFECDTIELSYDEGGILYTVDGLQHRFTDITTGRNALFNLADSSLKLNGVEVSATDFFMVGKNASAEFYAILPGPIFVVIEP